MYEPKSTVMLGITVHPNHLQDFIQDLGWWGGEMAICNSEGGGIAPSSCTALGNVAESGGTPPPF